MMVNADGLILNHNGTIRNCEKNIAKMGLTEYIRVFRLPCLFRDLLFDPVKIFWEEIMPGNLGCLGLAFIWLTAPVSIPFVLYYGAYTDRKRSRKLVADQERFA